MSFIKTTIICPVFLLFLSTCCLAQQTETKAAEAEIKLPSESVTIFGYWQNVDEADYYISFETERLVQVTENNELLSLPIEAYESDSIAIADLGQATPGKMVMKYRFTDGLLELQACSLLKSKYENRKVSLKFRKMLGKPLSLKIKALAVAENIKLEDEAAAKIGDSLRERTLRDQRSRMKGKFDAEAYRAQNRDYRWLKETVSKHGWIDVDRFGERATVDAFLIAQHCLDLRLKLAAQAGIANDLQKGHAMHGIYTWIYDRNLLYTNGKQRFGTHYRRSSKGIEILPLDNDEKINQWRKEVHLTLFADYVKSLRGRSSEGKVVVLDSLRKKNQAAAEGK